MKTFRAFGPTIGKTKLSKKIINILNNPDISAMWATDGGESAIEVVNLLNEYDKNPEKVKKQISRSYINRK